MVYPTRSLHRTVFGLHRLAWLSWSRITWSEASEATQTTFTMNIGAAKRQRRQILPTTRKKQEEIPKEYRNLFPQKSIKGRVIWGTAERRGRPLGVRLRSMETTVVRRSKTNIKKEEKSFDPIDNQTSAETKNEELELLARLANLDVAVDSPEPLTPTDVLGNAEEEIEVEEQDIVENKAESEVEVSGSLQGCDTKVEIEAVEAKSEKSLPVQDNEPQQEEDISKAGLDAQIESQVEEKEGCETNIETVTTEPAMQIDHMNQLEEKEGCETNVESAIAAEAKQVAEEKEGCETNVESVITAEANQVAVTANEISVPPLFDEIEGENEGQLGVGDSLDNVEVQRIVAAELGTDEEVKEMVMTVEEKSLEDVYEEEEKAEMARQILYEELLPRVFDKVDSKIFANLSPGPITVEPVVVEAQVWVGSDDGVAPVVVEPVIVQAGDIELVGYQTPLDQSVDNSKLGVEEENELAMEDREVTTLASPDLKLGDIQQEAEVEQSVEKDEKVQAMIDAEGLDVLQDVLQDPQHRDEPDEIETTTLSRVTSIDLDAAYDARSISVLKGLKPVAELDIEEEEETDVLRQESVLLFESASLAVAELKPLTQTLSYVVKDEKLRLESDLIALGLMRAQEEKAARESEAFRKASKMNPTSEFYTLVRKFYDHERKVAKIPAVLTKSKEKFDKQVAAMWPRETKVVDKTLFGAKNGVKVTHSFSYERTWCSESDARKLTESLYDEVQVLLPELTRQRFAQRAAFLDVEMHLFDIQFADEKAIRARLSITGVNVLDAMQSRDGSNGTRFRVQKMLKCADVLFYFLKKHVSSGSMFHDCAHKWIRIISDWVYKQGTLEEQEYLFRHIIRTKKGLKIHKHKCHFPADIERWGTDISRHFLKIMYLLCSPIGSERAKTDEDYASVATITARSNARVDLNPDIKDIRVTPTDLVSSPDGERINSNSTQQDIKQKLKLAALDAAAATASTADGKATWKASLKEEDMVHLLECMPVKEFLSHIFLKAFNTAAGSSLDWRGPVNRALGTAKAVMYMLGNAIKKLPLYVRFREQLCKVLAWTCQALVDSYERVRGQANPNNGQPETKGDDVKGVADANDLKTSHIYAGGYVTLSEEFTTLVQREIDWLIARCMALVNSTENPSCRSYLCLFPLRHLTHKGAFLIFQILFRGVNLDQLLDSGYKFKEMKFETWQDLNSKLPLLRKSFFESIAQNAKTASNITRLVALNSLALSMPHGSSLPRIWLHEMFLAAFVNSKTRQILSAHCPALILNLCNLHPDCMSQLLKDIDHNFFKSSTHEPSQELIDEITDMIQHVNIDGYTMTSEDVGILRRFLEAPKHFCFQVSSIFFMRYKYPSLIVEKKEKEFERIEVAARLILPALGEARISLLVEQKRARLRKTPGPPMRWWCMVLEKIVTHNFSGSQINTDPSPFPSQACVDRLDSFEMATALRMIKEDPILRYISLVTARDAHQVESFRSDGWSTVQSLIRNGDPTIKLGFKALYSVLPALAITNTTDVLDIQRILNDEKRGRRNSSTVLKKTGTELIRDMLHAHIASVIIQEVLFIKEEQPEIRWNTLLAQKPKQDDNKSARNLGPSAANRIEAWKRVGGETGSVLDLWMQQIAAIKDGGGRGVTTGTTGKGWLSDHTCRKLMDEAFRAIYRLFPTDLHHEHNSGVEFIRSYCEIHNKSQPTQKGEKGFEPPASPLGPKSDLNVSYPFLTFQILTELTAMDEENWNSLGLLCVKNSGSTISWKKALKSLAPATNKLVLWKSVIRDWLRHAIHAHETHPTTPAYWHQFFRLYFAKVPSGSDILDYKLNPGGFYGFQFVQGQTGKAMMAKAEARLHLLHKLYETKNPELSKHYLAMYQWVSTRPRMANSEIARWGGTSTVGYDMTDEEKAFFGSPCPKDKEVAICWRVNQIYLRARNGLLPSDMAPKLLWDTFFNADPAFDRTESKKWIDFGENRANKILRIGEDIKQYIPMRAFESIFNTDYKAVLPLDQTVKRADVNLRRETTMRANQTRRLLGHSTGNPAIQSILIIPPELRRPVGDSLDEETQVAISDTILNVCRKYDDRVKRLKAAALQVKQLSRRIYRNEPKITSIVKKTNGGLFKKQEDVTFEFNHTEVVEVKNIRRTMDSKRDSIRNIINDSPKDETYMGFESQVSDVASQLILLSRLCDHLITTHKNLQTLQDSKVKETFSRTARRWLYAVVDMETKTTAKYPCTKDELLPLISKMSVFVTCDFDSQLRLVRALQAHPNLVPELSPALKPVSMLKDHHASDADYVALFVQACRLRMQIKRQDTRIVATALLKRFKINKWINKLSPEVQEVVSLMNHVALVVKDQFRLEASPKLSKMIQLKFKKKKEEAVSFLVQAFAACAAYKFPKAFSPAWNLLLKGAIASPRSLPPKIWDAITTVPIAKLKWSKLRSAIKQLGQYVATIAVEKARLIRKQNSMTSALYASSGKSAKGLLGFVKSMVLAAIRKLHYVQMQAPSSGVSPHAVQQTIRTNMKELWGAAWEAFKPWLLDKNVAVRGSYREMVRDVCRRFAEVVGMLCLPNAILPDIKRTGAVAHKPLWSPREAVEEFWKLFTDKIARRAHPAMITQIHIALTRKVEIVNAKIRVEIPLAAFKWDTKSCSDMNSLLLSPWDKATSKESAAYRVQEITSFCITMLYKGDWSSSMEAIKSLDEKSFDSKGGREEEKRKVKNSADNTIGEYCVNFLSLINHCCLVQATPYPSEFAEMLRELLHRDWTPLDEKKFEALLVTTTDLLYKRPGHPFNNTIIQKQKAPLSNLSGGSTPAMLSRRNPKFHLERLDSASTFITEMESNITISAATVATNANDGDAKTTDNKKNSNNNNKNNNSGGAEAKGDAKEEVKAPGSGNSLPPTYSASEFKGTMKRQMTGSSGKLDSKLSGGSAQSINPPQYSVPQELSTVPKKNSDSKLTKKGSGLAEVGRSARNPGRGYNNTTNSLEEKKDTVLGLGGASGDAGGVVSRPGSAFNTIQQQQDVMVSKRLSALDLTSEGGMKSRIEEVKAAAAAAAAMGVQEKAAEWVPSYRRDRAAFVLRFMMAMALPYRQVVEGLSKTQMYTEWLLSVFHPDGPQPVTSDISWYVQLSKQVLTHLNNNSKTLLTAAPRKAMVEILVEFSMAARAAEAHELKALTSTLTTDYPNLVYEVITSFCHCVDEKDVGTTAEKIEMSITTALGTVEKVRQASSRHLLMHDEGEESKTSKPEGVIRKGAGRRGSTLTKRVLVGARGFGWRLVGDSLELKGDLMDKFQELCINQACFYALSGCVVRSMTNMLPLAFQNPPRKALSIDHASFDAVHRSLMLIADNLTAMTLKRVEELESNGDIREVEFAIISTIRIILSAQISMIRYAGYDHMVESRANILVGSVGMFLRKAYQHGKFGSSKMQRLGGRVAGFFGRKESAHVLTPRFRLLCRGVFTFIALREDEKSSPKEPKYSWKVNCLAPSRNQTKILKRFADQIKAKAFRNLMRKAQEIEGALASSNLTLVQIDSFFTTLVVQLFPAMEWPAHWYEPDSLSL
ncbi:hypothetical protein AAMO2058_000208100 [Amorphochlora amoebiformis]